MYSALKLRTLGIEDHPKPAGPLRSLSRPRPAARTVPTKRRFGFGVVCVSRALLENHHGRSF